MTELLTAEQMRARERAAIESGNVTGLALMERAGEGVLDAIFEHWPDLKSGARNAVVLCGPGNNGGDGFVVARLLQARGWQVQVRCLGDPDQLPADARANYDRWRVSGTVGAVQQMRFDAAVQPDLIVDALFGTGLTRPLDASLGAVIAQVNALGARVLSVDMPSGVCADSGRALGPFVQADLTVTFHSEKPGHLLTDGARSHTGKTLICDIGLLAQEHSAAAKTGIVRNDAPPLSLLNKSGAAHKFDHGHAVVVSGPGLRTGAARLAARGALRIGAGLVTVAARDSALPDLTAHLTAIMLRRIDSARDLQAQVAQDRRISALCAGPALGTDAFAVQMVGAVLALGRATVLDADALTVLAENPALFDVVHAHCVLTPHAGEFARLFPDISDRLAASPTRGPAYSKIDATRAAARRSGCVVLFKGADTVIADPGGACVINPPQDGAAWLATAGSGDVLAGFICGLLARGLSPLLAASTAAYLHASCARSFGPGLIAEDLPEELPGVLRALAP